MTCEEFRSLIGKWEDGSISGEEAAAAAGHVETCPACSRHYAALAPFLLRDGKNGPVLTADGGEEAVPDLAGPVMRRLAARRFRVRGRGVRRLVLAPALAVLIAGLGFFSTYRIFFAGAADEVVVRFVIDLPDARSVSLAGDFSDWKPNVYRLSRETPSGTWEIRVRLSRGKSYTYNFIVDGQEWIPDPKAQYRVDDGFGGESSLLRL